MRKRNAERGQSMLEFALLMPIIVTMVMILIEVEMAISAGIVNNRFSRQHLYFLFFNSRNYPENKFLALDKGQFMGRFWVGVDAELIKGKPKGSPKAPTIKIGRFKPPTDDQAGEVSARQNVRIRAMAFTCVPPYGASSDAPFSEAPPSFNDKTFDVPGPGFCQQ